MEDFDYDDMDSSDADGLTPEGEARIAALRARPRDSLSANERRELAALAPHSAVPEPLDPAELRSMKAFAERIGRALDARNEISQGRDTKGEP